MNINLIIAIIFLGFTLGVYTRVIYDQQKNKKRRYKKEIRDNLEQRLREISEKGM